MDIQIQEVKNEQENRIAEFRAKSINPATGKVYTQGELGKKCGLVKQTIWQLEQGRSQGWKTTRFKLVAIFEEIREETNKINSDKLKNGDITSEEFDLRFWKGPITIDVLYPKKKIEKAGGS